MVYLKDVPLELVWVVFLLVGGGEGGRRTPTSAYLVAFGVEESKLCKGTLKKKQKKKKKPKKHKAAVLPPCIPIAYSQQGQRQGRDQVSVASQQASAKIILSCSLLISLSRWLGEGMAGISYSDV